MASSSNNAAVIVRKRGSYEVRSESGAKRLGKYPTKAAAVKRLRQIEYFKSHPRGKRS